MLNCECFAFNVNATSFSYLVYGTRSTQIHSNETKYLKHNAVNILNRKQPAWTSGVFTSVVEDLISGQPGHKSRKSRQMGTWARHFQNCESDAPIWTLTQAAAFMGVICWWLVNSTADRPIERNPNFWIQENFYCGIGILGFGIGNTAQGIRNPTNESRIQGPLTKSRNPAPGIRNPDSKTLLDSFTCGEAELQPTILSLWLPFWLFWWALVS